MRAKLFLAVLLLAAPALPAPLPAQTVFLPRVGVLAQGAPFTKRFDDPPPEFREVWRYRFGPNVTVGAALEFGGARPLRLRVEGTHAPWLSLGRESGSPGPDVHESASGTVSTLTAAVVVQPERACVGRVCPRLLAGGGVKRYRFDADVISDDIVSPFAKDQSQATLQLGVGAAVRLRRFTLVAEVNDYGNRVDYFYEGERGGRVHDTLATVSVAIPFR